MPSLNFEQERRKFGKYYDNNRPLFEKAQETYISLIDTLIKQSDIGEVTKIEGRIKDKSESIKKFHRKYQGKLESEEQPYRIRDYISDLIGIRIVCLYEDQIAMVAEVLQKNFRIIDVTDKISAVESTDDSFGYKGLHMDLALSDELAAQPQYQQYAKLPFEVQIRSLIQDAWSVLDHKIKYKKSIPNDLRRRINALSALFELADREFKEIRNATAELMQQATVAPIEEENETPSSGVKPGERRITAFDFLRVAGHFFRDFEFEDYKVDGFVQDILRLDEDFEKSDLHRSLVENFKRVKEYRAAFLAEDPENTFSPYTSIRHCLYLYDRITFQRILSRGARERFEAWLDGRTE
ncbi:MAG: (p)ppGpp synthetase [Desulfuromonadales bacterium]|nr:(p)ppGpp synthetase [Desulfuromonadales bacterium]